MKRELIDYTVIVLYFLFVTGIGFLLKRRVKTGNDSGGKVSVDKALTDLLSEGIEQGLNEKKIDQLTKERDGLLQQLKQLKTVSRNVG